MPYTSVIQYIEKEGLFSQYEHTGSLLIALEATGEFSSNHIQCPECCVRHHKNGKTGIPPPSTGSRHCSP